MKTRFLKRGAKVMVNKMVKPKKLKPNRLETALMGGTVGGAFGFYQGGRLALGISNYNPQLNRMKGGK